MTDIVFVYAHRTMAPRPTVQPHDARDFGTCPHATPDVKRQIDLRSVARHKQPTGLRTSSVASGLGSCSAASATASGQLPPLAVSEDCSLTCETAGLNRVIAKRAQ